MVKLFLDISFVLGLLLLMSRPDISFLIWMLTGSGNTVLAVLRHSPISALLYASIIVLSIRNYRTLMQRTLEREILDISHTSDLFWRK